MVGGTAGYTLDSAERSVMTDPLQLAGIPVEAHGAAIAAHRGAAAAGIAACEEHLGVDAVAAVGELQQGAGTVFVLRGPLPESTLNTHAWSPRSPPLPLRRRFCGLSGQVALP